MKPRNENWLDDLRRKVDDYEMPVGEDLWQRIAADTRPKRQHPIRLYWSAVAAVIVALLGVAVYLYMPVAESDAIKICAASELLPDYHSGSVSSSTNVAEVTRNESSAKTERLDRNGLSTEVVAVDTVDESSSEPLGIISSDDSVDTVLQDSVINSYNNVDNHSYKTPTTSQSARQISPRSNSSKWQVSIAMTNQFAGSKTVSAGYVPLMPTPYGYMAKVASRNEAPDFNHSYYSATANTVNRFTSTDDIANIPVTYDISLRYNIKPRLGLNFGLRYTVTSSERRSGTSTDFYTSTRRAHYIGIPLNISYTFLDTRYLSVYALAGGSIEKCVAATRRDQVEASLIPQSQQRSYNLDSHPWQGQLSAGLGAQFNFTNRYAIFTEPQLYYDIFDSNAMPLKDRNTFGFQLSFGIRLSY